MDKTDRIEFISHFNTGKLNQKQCYKEMVLNEYNLKICYTSQKCFMFLVINQDKNSER